ncbi:MAG TPA: PLP-dependent aminotransferase family protein [Acidimicrobiales bacterium]|nr:PLP-dependent aminotransferase family protein [Acidimicrobiales bacterium]
MSQSVEGVIGRWSDGPGPLHRKLSDALRRAIERGHLPAGDRLPSERDLALRLAVSRSTVVAAYDTLRSEGLLESRQGSGTRVCTGATTDPHVSLPVSPIYRSLIDDPGDLISLACAVFPSHPLVAEALAAVAAEDADKLLAHTGYLPAGLPTLREALAESLTDEGTPTTPDQILITTGAQQAVSLATTLIVRAGDDVVVETPSFSGTLDIFRARGARLVPVPVDDEGVDTRAVAAAVAAARPALLYLMPTFHNPTGASLAAHRRRDIAELVAAQDLPLVEDNALEGAPLDDERPRPIAAYAPPGAPVLTAGSFSKTAWGGLRVGWLRGPATAISRLAEIKAMNDLGSPLLDQAVAARLVPYLPKLRDDHRVMLRHNLAVASELLAAALPEWEWRVPQGGPSLWIRLPGGNAAAFAQMALRYGVEVIPGDVMSPTGDHGDHIRFPYTGEPPVLEEIVRRLAQAWRAYRPVHDMPATRRPVVV